MILLVCVYVFLVGIKLYLLTTAAVSKLNVLNLYHIEAGGSMKIQSELLIYCIVYSDSRIL